MHIMPQFPLHHNKHALPVYGNSMEWRRQIDFGLMFQRCDMIWLCIQHTTVFCQCRMHILFPERRFVAGFFRRLLACLTPHISHTYLTPHISHTYPSHHTYPTHIHSKRIPPIRIPPIRIRSTRIPPVRIHAMRIHSKRLHQQVLQYVSHQYVSHQYKSVQHVSHQYVSMLCVSIQKVCISRNRKRIPPIHIPPIRIFNTYPTSTDPFNAYPFKKFASAGMAMSMSIIAYHSIPLLLGGNGNEYRNLAFPSISLQNYYLNIIVSRAYEHEIHC